MKPNKQADDIPHSSCGTRTRCPSNWATPDNRSHRRWRVPALPMIDGTVNDRYEPMVDLVVLGPGGQRREVRAVVDNGYNGSPQLPQPAIEELQRSS